MKESAYAKAGVSINRYEQRSTSKSGSQPNEIEKSDGVVNSLSRQKIKKTTILRRAKKNEETRAVSVGVGSEDPVLSSGNYFHDDKRYNDKSYQV